MASASALASTDQLLSQLAELIDGLDDVSENIQGPVTLQALRKSGVSVPEIFVRNQQLAWPWGELTLTRNGHEWIIDLHSAPTNLCKPIQLGANRIPGIVRIATSGLAKDEAKIPVTAEHADAACSNTSSDIIRIIATDKSITRLALEKLAAAWRRLGRVFAGN